MIYIYIWIWQFYCNSNKFPWISAIWKGGRNNPILRGRTTITMVLNHPSFGPPDTRQGWPCFFLGGTFCQQFFRDSKLGKTKKHVTKSPNVNTLPETNIAHEILIFPSIYHQNGEFSMVSWRVFLANILKTPTKWNHIDFEYSYQHVMEKMGEELIHAPSINTDSTYSKQQNGITKFFQHTLFSCDMFFFPHVFFTAKKNKSWSSQGCWHC